MRYSGIGGQAVMEGVMMKNEDLYAVAVRKPDGEIIIDKKEYRGILPDAKIKNFPFLRGVLRFADSMIIGMKTLMYSASFFEEEEEKTDGKQPQKESAVMGITMAVSVAAAIFIFMLIPYFLSDFFKQWIASPVVSAVAEGIIRMGIFLAYILLISQLKDIQRVFMYHGAEHKCINCIEHGMELNVENVRKSSRLHKRCGTSFLFLVICISIITFLFIQTDSGVLRIVLRLLFVPVIAGAAYEFIRLAGKSDHALIVLLSRPGMALQKLTTKEPDDSMIEVGIASVEAVFDWRAYLKENQETGHDL